MIKKIYFKFVFGIGQYNQSTCQNKSGLSFKIFFSIHSKNGKIIVKYEK